MKPKAIDIDGSSLTPELVLRIARDGIPVVLAPRARDIIQRSKSARDAAIASGAPVYGVTTGFGDSVKRHIDKDRVGVLQANMVAYHLNGTGPVADRIAVRAAIVIRANTLARGVSGVSLAVVERLLDLLNLDVTPLVPVRGSVGASGDLVPLSYIANVVIGQGEVIYKGVELPTSAVLAELGLKPIVLEAKDGLALINGTSFSAAFACVATGGAKRIATSADQATALACEALLGNRDHFSLFIHDQRPHPGQVRSARRIREALHDSNLAVSASAIELMNAPLEGRKLKLSERPVQDRYSLRCAPQVIGVLYDTIDWVENWISVEINGATDNPLFDPYSGQVHSGGNFYAGHIAQAMDALQIATASVADLLDRQLELMVDEKFNNGLTPNLIESFEPDDDEAGVHHGFKGMQIACSALVAEALKNCSPASAHSRSTEAHNQDKVSMAPIAARSACYVATLTIEVLAIHLLAAAQATDLRGVDNAGSAGQAMVRLVRTVSPRVSRDRRLDRDIAAVVRLIESDAVHALAGAEL